MSDHVVSQLDLHVQGPDVSRADSGLARRFAHAVLERACDRIETKLNGRILAIRKLPFRILLARNDLSDSNAIEDAARDLSAVLERHLHNIPTTSAAAVDPQAPLLLFQTPHHQHAAALELLASDINPWFAPQLTSLDQALAALADDPPFALQVLLLLEDQRILQPILAACRASTLNRLVQLVNEQNEELIHAGSPDSSHAEISLSHPSISSAPILRLLQTLERFLAPTPAAMSDSPALASTDADSDSSEAIATPLDLKTIPLNDSPALPQPRRTFSPLQSATPSLAPIPTTAAGLFYLLNPAVELDAGEILWRAGVDEPMIFTDAARLIAADAASTDPAFIHFGGASSSSADWPQAQQIATALLVALATTITRRKLHQPSIQLCELHLQGTRATLICLPPHVPILAIMPGDRDSLPPDLWPFGMLPSSNCHTDAVPSEPVIEEYLASAAAADLPRRAIAATVAGSLCALASLRLMNIAPDSSSSCLAAALRTPGQLLIVEEELTVRISSDHLLLPIRRAGLDRDPGWIPWQKRHVQFEFIESDQAATEADL